MLEPGEHHQLRILTPHAGELNALLAKAGVRVSSRDIAADPIRWARWAAVAYDCVVLLKGSATICTAPDGYTLIVHASTPDLATAGSGDVLTGILGTLLAAANLPATPAGDLAAQTHRLTDLAAAGALIHAHAGALAAHEGRSAPWTCWWNSHARPGTWDSRKLRNRQAGLYVILAESQGLPASGIFPPACSCRSLPGVQSAGGSTR